MCYKQHAFYPWLKGGSIMKCYPGLILAVVFSISTKATAAAQAPRTLSDFDECAAVLSEFTHKYPNPTLTERIEGYYLVAQCQEKMGQLNAAMSSYAKAVTVGGELAESATVTKAKQRLEQLYKAYHNGTLVGIEKIYKKAGESLMEPEK
jgi:hypothetical protein